MKNKYTAQASTIEEAVKKALKVLGITQTDADIEVVDPGKKGFLGFGQKDAVVTVSRKEEDIELLDEFNFIETRSRKTEASPVDTKDKPEPPKVSDQDSGPLEVNNTVDLGISRKDLNQSSVKKEKLEDVSSPLGEQTRSQEVEEPVRENHEDLEENQSDLKTDQFHGKVSENQETESVVVASQEVVETSEEDLSHEAKIRQEEKERFEAEYEEEEEVFLSDEDEIGIQRVKEYLETILKKMQVTDAVVQVKVDLPRVHYDIETDDAGLVIGRHGKVLNGLQTLIQIQLHQHAEKKLFAKVDAENYRSRRKDSVEQLATKTARKVTETNQPVILEPMPAHERKQIHRLLHSYEELKTHSEGKEPHRYLVVEKR